MNIPIFPMEKLYQFVIQTDKKNELIYNQRGQTNQFRRLQQNFLGKIGEVYVDWYFNCGCREHILEDTGMGQHRSDIKFKEKGIGIKTQDKSSANAYGTGRFVFSQYDKLESDIYVGLIIDPQTKSTSTIFKDWFDSIEQINVEFSFVCKQEVLKTDVWENTSNHLKGKRILVSNKIPQDKRIDLKSNFPTKF